MLASTASLLHLLQCCQVKKSRKKKCFTVLSIFLKLPAQSYNDLILTPGVFGGAGGKQYLEVQEASSTWGAGGAGGKQWVSGGAGGNCRYLEVQEASSGYQEVQKANSGCL